MTGTVVFLINSLVVGGAERCLITLSKGIVDAGYRVAIVLTKNRPVELPIPAGVSVISCACDNAESRFSRKKTHVKKIDDYIDSLDDVVLISANLHYTHQVMQHSKYADEVWFCIHNNIYLDLAPKERGALFRKIKLRKLYKNKKIISVSNSVKNSISDLGVKPRISTVLYNPVDVENIKKMMLEPQPIHDEYVLFVGRLYNRAKRYDRLLHSYKASGIAELLVIVGAGETDEVKKMISQLGLEDRVIMAGVQDNPFKYMYHAKALLLTSDYEGLPTVIIESFVCGTPVLSTDCPSGPGELLLGEQRHFLVDVDNEIELASKLKEIVVNPPHVDCSYYSRFALTTIVGEYMKLASNGGYDAQ